MSFSDYLHIYDRYYINNCPYLSQWVDNELLRKALLLMHTYLDIYKETHNPDLTLKN